jgi:Zn-finger nucleic acid-binding protein
MLAIDVGESSSAVRLDACRNCQLLWLDPGELEALPSGRTRESVEEKQKRIVASLPPETQ